MQAVCRSIEVKNQKTLMIAFNKVRLRRCSSPQPRYGLSVFEQHLQILLRGGDWSNIEVLHKVVQHIGRNERRQRGAKANILVALSLIAVSNTARASTPPAKALLVYSSQSAS